MTRCHASYLAVFALILLVAAPLSAQQLVPAPTGLPFNLQINPVLIPVVQELLAASPAFAAQCARIGAARYVRVMVNPVMSSSTSSRGTARTAMRRFSTGALTAVVSMPVPLTFVEYAELFGHELEHILEQIDRVDLAALTAAGEGASRLSDGAYETTRARRAGLLIAEQTERPRSVVAVTVARNAQLPADTQRDSTPTTRPSREAGGGARADAPPPSQPGNTNSSSAAAAIRQF